MTTTTIIIVEITVMTLFILFCNIDELMYCEYTPPFYKKNFEQQFYFHPLLKEGGYTPRSEVR